MNYYIYAPSYDENSGGCIALHRLCHIINSIDGHQAFLVPRVIEKLEVTNFRTFVSDLKNILKFYLKKITNEKYITNQNWNTPVITKRKIKDLQSSIVVYPEVTYGNPLNGKNIVRWFLHQPGYLTKRVNFGIGELHYKFNSAIKDFTHCLSQQSKLELKIIYYPLEYYNLDDVDKKYGCCHTIRKGKHKTKVHPTKSVLIDGLSHKEISHIFKRSKRFISYDDYTAYSLFAVLCGCESIVVPNDNMTKEQWYPSETDRYGIAYGFSESEIKFANKTRSKVLEHILNEHKKTFDIAKKFTEETQNFFFIKN
ncbi:WavQ [Proteus terrae]|uniref:WavQ n=1 Tax=Proteus terrae TaxID=1574161 RepID=UPI001330EE63|nr:WavQ [Proteus terrae]QKD70346.1 WavQ [Proteus terrae subsp. cibarius]QKD72174.1 WavQ [Proteus terrae subsp. cibarius]UDF26751.1 WavQ [Proteus terrae subsp. cibarius]